MINETPQANFTVAEKLRYEISEIEHAIDSGAYRPGPWARLLTRARATSGADRLAISADVSRVSRKLHLRGGRRTISAQTGVIIEASGDRARLFSSDAGGLHIVERRGDRRCGAMGHVSAS